MTIKLAVTGTKAGMTDSQIRDMMAFLARNPDIDELHHGSCIGVDVEAANLAKYRYDIRTVCHPPADREYIGQHDSDETREPLTHFKRNRAMVDECDLLVVIPYQDEWQQNGGTWYTHDYALRKGKPVFVFWPERPTTAAIVP